MKKIISLVTAAATALSIMATAHAAETKPQENVFIAGHECWVENGYYFTDVDGEKCQVINLDDYIQVDLNEQNGIEPYSTINGVYYDAELPLDQYYEGRINITNGDDETPTFFIDGTAGVDSVEVKTNFILPTSYNVTVWYNFGISSDAWQDDDPQTITFFAPIQTHKFFIGTARQNDCLFKMVFHKAGSSTTETNFRYWIKAATM